MGADEGAAAWVEETCRSLSTAELFVQPDMGDSRFAEATSVLRTLLGWGFERSWPDDSQVVQDEVQPYYEKVLGLVLPSLVVAALLLLCLLPLWVSRCCAHRCCAPTRLSYSSKHKGRACGCCSLWGVAVLVCVVIGLLSSAQVVDGARAHSCALHSSLRVVAEQARAIDSSLVALSDVGSAYRRDTVVPAVGALEGLVRSFDPPAGVAHQACAEMQQASEIARALGVKVAEKNVTFAGQKNAAWRELNQSLAQAVSQSCLTLAASVQAPVDQAVAELAEVTGLVDDAFGPSAWLTGVSGVIGPLSSSLLTTQGDLAEAMRDSWVWWRPDSASGAPLFAWLLFVGPLLLLVLAAVGALCMVSSAHTGSCRSRAGVLLSGCAWVGSSVCSVLLLLVCTALVMALVTLFDLGSILKDTTDPSVLIGEERCAAPWNDEFRAAGEMTGLTLFLDTNGDGARDAGLNLCNVVEGCMREPAVAAQGAVEAAFGVKLDTATWDAAVADAVNSGGWNGVSTAELDSASGSGLNATRAKEDIDPGALCDGDGGCPAQVKDMIISDLDLIVASVGRGLARIDETIVLVRAALQAAQEMVDRTPAVTAAIRALGANLDCAWLKPAYRAPLEALFGGDGVLGGLAGLAISIGVCGVAGILLLGWLVTLQVYSGGVGKQPGCPRPCRCCCPAPKRDYPSCLAAETECIPSTVVVV